MNTKVDYSVIIIGGGMVGLALACALSQSNLSIAVIEAKVPKKKWRATDYDARASSLNQASIRFLKKLQIWDKINPKYYSPLEKLCVWDGLGDAQINFDSADIGQQELGAITENREIIRALWAELSTKSNVSLLAPKKPSQITTEKNYAVIELDDGQQLKTQLVVGADGARSSVREMMDSDTHERSYQQKAIVAVVSTEMPHQQTGWQVFQPTGPLALLPLRNKNHCAIVWSNNTSEAEELMALDPEELECELNNSFGIKLGDIKILSKPLAIPLTMRHVKQYVKHRMALVGDAAHTIHPLAGQGVNLGLMDAAYLAHFLLDAHNKNRDLGELKALRRYERSCKGDNTLMLTIMRGFKELFSCENTIVVQARNLGIKWVNKTASLKKCCMQLAAGEKTPN